MTATEPCCVRAESDIPSIVHQENVIRLSAAIETVPGARSVTPPPAAYQPVPVMVASTGPFTFTKYLLLYGSSSVRGSSTATRFWGKYGVPPKSHP